MASSKKKDKSKQVRFALPAKLAKLVGLPCASAEDPTEQVIVFDWARIPEDKKRQFLAQVFHDSKVPGDFSSLLDRDTTAPTEVFSLGRGQKYWKSRSCVPFGLAYLSGSKATQFEGGWYPQFGRLLLIDVQGAVFHIDVSGTAINRPEPAKTARRWEDLKLEIVDDAFRARIKAAQKATSDVCALCEGLIKKATPLFKKGKHAAALALLEPEMRDRAPSKRAEPGPKYNPSLKVCAAVGGAFDLYGLSLFHVGRHEDALEAFRKSHDSEGKYSPQAFAHFVAAACRMGDAAGAAAFASERTKIASYLSNVREQANAWVAEVGSKELGGLEKLAVAKGPRAAVARSLLEWLR